MFIQDYVSRKGGGLTHPQSGKIKNIKFSKGDFVFDLSRLMGTIFDPHVVQKPDVPVAAIHSQPISARVDNIIRIWRVGSPYDLTIVPSNKISPELIEEFDKFGYKYECTSYSAKGFGEFFASAVAKHQEPDIVVFNNYSILTGGQISEKNYSITGLYADPKIKESLIFVTESLKDLNYSRGWELLVSTSQNSQLAKAFAMRKFAIDTVVKGQAANLSADEIDHIKGLGIGISYGYIAGNSTDLKIYSDSQRIGSGILFSDKAQVASVSVDQIWGSNKLVFILTKVSYEREHKSLGYKSVMIVMRKSASDWRVLTVTDDPVSLQAVSNDIPRLTGMLKNNQLTGTPQTALLKTPDGQYPVPENEQRFGDFIWQTPNDSGLAAEIVEFEYGNATRFFIKFNKPGTENRISTGSLWTTHSRWNWRVWSIDKNGNIGLSPTRSFNN